ncbi:MAG: hypothetical protein M0001_09875 [Treponema sp.]|nr:hypothetical protein [Treponema sp.]
MQALRIITEIAEDRLEVANLRQFKGRRVEVIIMPLENELEGMRVASMASLAGTWGDAEPEYAASDVREGNPEYEAR